MISGHISCVGDAIIHVYGLITLVI